MRTNEERIAAMHQRVSELKQERTDRRIRTVQYGSFVLALTVVIVIAVMMPRFSDRIVQGTIPAGMNASIFAQGEALGFVVIAILSFMLGIAVTIFCFYLKRQRGE